MEAIWALKVENWSLFSSTESIALSKRKKRKKKRKQGDGKKEKIKKEFSQSWFLHNFWLCIRDFERLKMVAYFFTILRRFENAMPENPFHASGQ